MDEEERIKKLRAGKEKLAAFQKRKSKKKSNNHDKDHVAGNGTEESVGSMDHSSSSEVPLYEDSDNSLFSEDEMTTHDTKAMFKLETKLKHAAERIAELEESLEGKQLALDRVIEENVKLKEQSTSDKIVELETNLGKRDEIIRQLTTRLQSTVNLESEAEMLTQQVLQLQTQLVHAGKLMEAQNSKQLLSSQALVEAKNEIENLQKCIEDKDQLLNKLSENVSAISAEYVSLKSVYDSSHQTSDGDVSEIEVKVQEVRSQMEENYRNQIEAMKEELAKQYEMEQDNLTQEFRQLNEKLIHLEAECQSLSEEKQTFVSAQESSSAQMLDLQSQLENLTSQFNEIQSEKQQLGMENESLTKEMEHLQGKIVELKNSGSGLVLKSKGENSEQSEILEDLKEKNMALISEVETLRNELDSIKKQSEQATYQNEEESITQLKENNALLLSELEKRGKERDELRKQLDAERKPKGGRSPRFQVDSQEIVMELKQVTEQYEEALVNIALLQGKVEDYNIRCEDLNEDLDKMKERLEKSDEVIKDYEDKIMEYEKLKGIVGKSEQTVKQFEETVKSLEEKNCELLDEISEWKEKYKEVENQSKEEKEKMIELTEKLESVQKQSEEYRDKFVEYEQKYTDYEGLVTQFNELQHERNVFQNQNDDLNNKINIQQDIVMELKVELELLANQNQVYQEQALLQSQNVDKLTQENQSYQEIVSKQEKELNELTDKLTQTLQEVDTYKEKTTSLETLIQTLKGELKDEEITCQIKEKDDLIEKLKSQVSDLTTQFKELESENGAKRETVVLEECSPNVFNVRNVLKETETFQQTCDDFDTSNTLNFTDCMEEQIQQTVSNVLSTEFQPPSEQQEVMENQSFEVLQTSHGHEREMDADSLDGCESALTMDSLEENKRNDLFAQISELENQNQRLKNENQFLLNQNSEISAKLENLNPESSLNLESSDEDTLVQTFRLQIDSLTEEKSKLEWSYSLLEKSTCDQNESLATLEREKLALQTELTLVHTVIDQISHIEDESDLDLEMEGMSQDTLSSLVELQGPSQNESTESLCNKLKSVFTRLNESQNEIKRLRKECETLTLKKNENQDKSNLESENQRMCSQIQNLESDIEKLNIEIENQKQISNDLQQTISEKEKITSDLEQSEETLQRIKNDCQKLIDENEQLKISLNKVEEEKQTTLSELKISVDKNEQLQKSLEVSWEKEQALENQVLRLTEEISNLSTINQVVNGVRENLENRFVEVAATAETGQPSHDLMSTNQNRLSIEEPMMSSAAEILNAGVDGNGSPDQKEATDVQKCAIDVHATVEQVINQNTEVIGHVDGVENEVTNDLHADKKQLIKMVQGLEEENKSLRAQVSGSYSNTNVRNTLENKILELVSENQKIKEEFIQSQTNLREEHETLKLTMNSWKESSEASQILKDQITSLLDELKTLRQQKQELEGSYLESQALNEELKQELLNHQHKVQDLEKWQIYAEDLQSKCAEKDEKINELLETCRVLQAEKETECVKLSTKVNELSDMERNFSKSREMFQELELQCQSYIDEISNVQEKCAELEKQVDNVTIEKNTSREEEEKLILENISLKEKIDLQVLEHKRIEESMKTQLDEKENLMSESQTLQSQLSVHLQNEEHHKKMIKEKENEIANLTEVNIKSKEELDNLQREINLLSEKCQTLECAEKVSQARYSELIQSGQESEEQLQIVIETLSAENCKLLNVADSHEDLLSKIRNENKQIRTDLQRELDEKTKQLIEKEQRVLHILEEVEKNNKRFDELHSSKARLDNLNQEYAELQNMHQDCLDQLESLEMENFHLCKEHSEVSLRSENLQQSLTEYMEELEQTQRSLLKLQEDHYQLASKKEMLESENDSMKQQRETLSREISSLSEELAVVEEERNKFFKEQELREKDIKEQELKEQERKALELREQEIKAQTLRDQEIGALNVQEENNETNIHSQECPSTNLEEENVQCQHSNTCKDKKVEDKTLNENSCDNHSENEINSRKSSIRNEDDEFISEEEFEALIKQRMEHEKKQIEYDLEEKFEMKFRQREVELMHDYSQKQKDLEKKFEQQVNYKVESVRAEKDKAFVKTLQKVKKDFDKKLKREMENQRLVHLHEMAKLEDDKRGGGHVTGMVQSLMEENKELAEARDALLQQVELSHHQQAELEDELRHVITDNMENQGEFLHEPDQTKPRSYRNPSVLLDWEFSPTTSFEHDKDPPDVNGQYQFACQNSQCRLLRMKYQDLIGSSQPTGFHQEIGAVDDITCGTGFKPEAENKDFVNSDNISTPTTELEASFVKEALKQAAESFADKSQTSGCSTPSVDVFIANVEQPNNYTRRRLKSEKSLDDVDDDFIPLRCRSLSLNIPQDSDENLINEFVSKHNTKPSYMKHSRHKSWDEFTARHASSDGKFVAEIFHDQTLLPKSNSLSSSMDRINVQKENDLPKSVSHVTQKASNNETNLDSLEHNSQGEFLEECLSGDLETLSSSTLTNIAMMQSPQVPREITPDSHMDSEVFKSELTPEEKIDNEKLLKRLESLKNIYCKEKQDLLTKCESLTIQLENESLSRRQLEQELININEDFSQGVDDTDEGVKSIGNSTEGALGPKHNTRRSKSENDGSELSDSIDLNVEELVQDLRLQVMEKENSLKQKDTEMGMLEALHEQKLNELNVLFKSELKKLEIENSSLVEQKSQLEKLGKELEERLMIKNEDVSNASESNRIDIVDNHDNKDQNIVSDIEDKMVKNQELKVENATFSKQYHDSDLQDKTHTGHSLKNKVESTLTTEEEKLSQIQKHENDTLDLSHDNGQLEEMKVLQERCHNLELELENAKQSEAFASVLEERCKQYESGLQDLDDCRNELMEMTDRYEKLVRQHKEQNTAHIKELNSCTSVIEKLRDKCERMSTDLDEKSCLLEDYEEKCRLLLELEEKFETCESDLSAKKNMVIDLEEKLREAEGQVSELKTKCSSLSASVKIQKHKNAKIIKEHEQQCKQYESEIEHKEKALDEINETCAKFEMTGYENEHVIQELTSQCQKYQTEIQELRAKELLKMKKTLSCSVDEIEMTDYHEVELDESSAKFVEEDAKMHKSNQEEFFIGQTIVHESIIPKSANVVSSVSDMGDGNYVQERFTDGTMLPVSAGVAGRKIKSADDNLNLEGKVCELEALVKDKDTLIRKYRAEVEQLNKELQRLDDFREHQQRLEISVREKDSYIKQLEEHFLQQRTPISIRSPVKPGKYGNVGKKRMTDEKLDSEGMTCSTPTPDTLQDNDQLHEEMNESFSDQSTIHDDSFTEDKGELLDNMEPGPMSRSRSNDSLLSDKSENSTQTFNEGAELESKHFTIIEEISKLRQDLRETKSMYTQENSLLREALEREKWKREATLDKREMSTKFESEVEILRKKVDALNETNRILRTEKEEWLKTIQEQEEIVLQLREQLCGESEANQDKARQTFNQQFKLLQQQRNELLEKLHKSEQQVVTLSQNLTSKTVREESLQKEKAALQTKLYELEEVEKELTDKKIELEREKSRQKQLEEMIHHRDLIERELMKQKRLLEIELAEIECKLREKEELLEIQKNQLLEEIKQNYSSERLSDTSKLLSNSLDGSSASFDSTKSMHSSNLASTPRTQVHFSSVFSTPHKQSTSGGHVKSKTDTGKPWRKRRLEGNVNRLELMLSDVEKEHAEAISYLKEKLEETDKSGDSKTLSQSSKHSS